MIPVLEMRCGVANLSGESLDDYFDYILVQWGDIKIEPYAHSWQDNVIYSQLYSKLYDFYT